jgi:ribonuclease P protein component
VTLTRRSDFDRAFREGKRYRGRSLVVVCLRRSEGPLRAAFVAGKSLGNAVRRNRQRRRLREACRSLWSRIEASAADVVFLAQPPAAEHDFASVKAEMQSLLRRAGLLSVTEEEQRRASR